VAETVSIQDGTDQNQANVPFGNGRPGVSRELNSAMLMCVCVQRHCKRIYILQNLRVYLVLCAYRDTESERDYNDIYIYTYIICDMCGM
jgi:hypothetical protein